MIYIIIDNKKFQGMTIEKYLHHLLKAPVQLFFRLIRNKKIKINKKPAKLKQIINFQDHIIIFYKFAQKTNLPMLENLKIYEDQEKIFINKPIGMASQPGMKVFNNICDIIGDYCLVHRLDKETSGVMCIAKTPFDAKVLQEINFKKYYLGILDGVLKNKELVDQSLKKMHFKTIWTSEGKKALSHFTPLSYYENKTLCLIEIFTGRTHQIRAHSAYLNKPIYGDEKYGGAKADRMYLHAYCLIINGIKIFANLDEKFKKQIDNFSFNLENLMINY